MRIFFLLPLGLLLLGCAAESPTLNLSLDWRPSELSMAQCPDVSGDYTYLVEKQGSGYASNLLNVYAGSVYVLWQTAKINPTTGRAQTPLLSNQISNFQSFYSYESSGASGSEKLPGQRGVLKLKMTSHALIQGGANGAQVVTPLGTSMASCHGGALVLRHLEKNGGADFVPRTISYGEFVIKKNADRSLEISYSRRQRPVSAAGALGKATEFPSITRTYPAASP